MTKANPANCLTEYYRCPAELVRHEPTYAPDGRKGYFRFGSAATCYGVLSNAEPAQSPEECLCDALEQVKIEAGKLCLSFNPAEIVDNLRSEQYANVTQADSSTLMAALYYLIRPLLSVGVRKHLQRFRLKGWEKLPFPGWPIDHSVENLLEQLMLLELRASGAKKLPFIWFWPEGHSSCVIMTHDVETAKGRDFCSGLMDIDDSFQIKASFQVVPEKRYEVTLEFLESIRRRGFEVVIHDLNHDGRLYKNREQFLERAAKINAYGKLYKAEGFRAAVLYRNQQWYDELKFSYDMSIPNVARLDPQRGGCCTVMPYFIGNLLEIPVTMVQDYTLFNILNRYSIDLWQEQIEKVMGKHGLMSFIVHPDVVIGAKEQKVFEALMLYLSKIRSDRGAWITTPGEVNRWWRQRSSMTLAARRDGWEIEGQGKERAQIAYMTEQGGHLVFTHSEQSSAGARPPEVGEEYAAHSRR